MKYLVKQSYDIHEAFRICDTIEEVNDLFIASAMLKYPIEMYVSDHDFCYLEQLEDYSRMTTVTEISDFAADSLIYTLDKTFGNFIDLVDYLHDQQMDEEYLEKDIEIT